MLVLSRKVGQTIVIGDGIEITVVDMRGDQVRIGIDAPRNVPVNRKEILARPAAVSGPPVAPLEATDPLAAKEAASSLEVIARETAAARDGGSLRDTISNRAAANETLTAVAEPLS